MTVLAGRCHCGNMEALFETPNRPESLALRACACGFCRAHGMRATSDPAGRLTVTLRDPEGVNRYRFGLGTADFFVCRTCGVYLAAVMSEGDDAWGIVNINALDDSDAFTQVIAAMDYGAEDEDGRRARRRAKWTPATVVSGSPT